MEVELCVPKLVQLDYREALLGDSQTMSYNRGYDTMRTVTTRKRFVYDFRAVSGKSGTSI